VRAEATIAHRAKTMVPATIEPCDKPVMFELTQTADLAHWRGEVDDTAWLAFLDDVRRRTDRQAEIPEPTVSAPVPAALNAGAGIPQAGVLPFTFRGDDDELQFLAEDLTEDITRALAENDYFRVIAAGKMTAWRDKVPDYEAIGQQLEMRYLVEGKLQRANETMRLTVQLIDTDTANTVWSHRFAVSAEDMGSDSENFARIIASEVTEHVIQADMKRAITKSGPYTGMELVLRCMSLVSIQTPDSVDSLIEEARNAVAVAPDFGLAHAVLSHAIIIGRSVKGERLNESLRREVRHHATRAMQLDGDNITVITHVLRAFMHLGDLETCLRLALRAVDLRPASPAAKNGLAGAYMALGRTSDAIAVYVDQLRYSGFDSERCYALAHAGWCHLLEGNPQEAEELLNQSLALNPNYTNALKFKAIAEFLLDKERSAIATIQRLREIKPDLSIEQHLFFIIQNPRLGRRSGDHIAILRRLWDATGGDG
jgi:TolB-like protein